MQVNSNSSSQAKEIVNKCINAYRQHIKDPYGFKPLSTGGSGFAPQIVNDSNVAYI